jgi:hypothetical protein
VFEDDGKQASGTTSVVHDARRNLLFLSGEPTALSLSMFANLYLDSQVYLAPILPFVKLTKSGTFVHKTINVTFFG